MSNLQKLTISDLQRYFHAAYFERGLNYYDRGYIFNPIRRGNILEARCIGSLPNPYRVRSTLSETGIDSTDCSCPIGGGCKHAAALLLTWVHNPEAFTAHQPFVDLLVKRSKEDLIFLIQEMIKRDPDLEMLLDLPLPGGKTQGGPIDPEPYRRQVHSAFYGADKWGASFGVAGELNSITDMADQFAEAEDWRNAQLIYQVIVEEGLANYENAIHDEGEILLEIDRAAEGLAECLQAFEGDPIVRQGLLRSLFEVIAWDINMGGYGVGDAIPTFLIGHTNTEERQLLREWIMQEAAKADSMESFSQGWRKESWGRLLLRLDEREGDLDGFLQRARSQGMYRSLFNKLVELGRVEEATEVATTQLRFSDYDFLLSALTLEQKGYLYEAVIMVESAAADIKDSRLLAWLAEKYEARGNIVDALSLQLRRWESRPSLSDYQILERLAKSLDQWEMLRPKLLASLAENRHFDVLARIHLYEENWDAAWDAVTPRESRHQSTYIQEEVAQATEQHSPQRAITFYLSRAEHLIAQRGRKNYAAASQYLQRIRNLSKSIDRMDAWQQIIAALRENHRNLPALQDELDKAGLKLDSPDCRYSDGHRP